MDEQERLNRYQEYIDLTDEEIDKEFESLMDEWKAFLKMNASSLLANGRYVIHRRNIYETIRRVDKRKVYYKVFHKLNKINEMKQTALRCYWIVTLKPFFVTDETSSIYNSPNELFALYLIIVAIRSAYEEAIKKDPTFKNKDIPFQYPSEQLMGDIVYNFKYTGVTREGMISFVETFADNWGVGISYILSHIKDKNIS